MINSVIVTNHLGESLTLELRNPESSGFLIQSVLGLTPSKANVNTTDVLELDGAFINSVGVSKRNILIKLLFSDEPSVEYNRKKTYKYFPVKKDVMLEIHTDSQVLKTHGVVESNETVIFSKQTGTTISIVCPDAYLTPLEPIYTIFSGVVSSFEFPFENLSLVANLIEFGTVLTNKEQTVLYDGDAECGIIVRIHAVGPVSNLKISNTTTHELMSFSDDKFVSATGHAIQSGDEIIINTKPGSKSVSMIREGVEFNILSCLEYGYSWFTLQTGDNLFLYAADSGDDNLLFSIEHNPLYGGI